MQSDYAVQIIVYNSLMKQFPNMCPELHDLTPNLPPQVFRFVAMLT